MKARPERFVALLRGINVGGRHRLPMATLRSICEGIGGAEVQTYIQSGNVVFTATASTAELETRLEHAIEQQCRFSVPVIIRSSARWRRYIRDNPFPDESRDTPNLVVLALSKAAPSVSAVLALQRLAAHGEQVVKIDGALWIHYPGGIGRSKLTPAALDRFAGSPVTARNWRTVLKLGMKVQQSMQAE